MVLARRGGLTPKTRPPLAPGLRQTPQRQLVWQAIEDLGGHCTADEIASHVQSIDAGLARSTVYRALEALAASGAVHAVRLGGGAVHYELAGEEHHHAVCQMCEGVLHIEEDLVHDLEHHLEELHRFHPMRAEVLVVGVCDACARTRGKRPTKRRVLDHVHFE